jgi:phage terminase large subunit-like protein
VDKWQGYIEDVLSGKVVVCKYVRLAVERHVNDLARQNTEEFPFYFDAKAANRKIAFSQDQRHIKGEWAKRKMKITLEPWQQFIDAMIFGWKRSNSGLRRFTKAYIEVARKNGKTIMGATTANYCLFADGEEGAEVYFCATKRDQAKIAWTYAQLQIDKNVTLKQKVSLFKMSSTITINGTASLMRPVGQDSDTEDGLNPSFVLIDEYHAHRSADLLNVMQNGMGSRAQPLLYIITTAGFDKNSPCFQEERTLIVGMLEKSIPSPETVFGIIYSLDEDDDWADEKVWVKANPNLGVSVYHEFLRSQVTQAIASPAKQNDVKTKNFNTWTQAVSRWIGAEDWNKCVGPMPELEGRTCYGAFDLSSTTDLTAWVLVFPPKDLEKQYTILAHFFIPSDGLLDRERRDKVPYTLWRDQGYITTTPGNVIDYDYIEEQILLDAEKYELVQIAHDPYNAKQVVLHLQEEDQELIAFRQGFLSMSGPSKDFEKRVLNQELNHLNNPVLRWMMSCTEVESDAAGNIKPRKPDINKYGKRIDGIVAAIMALDRASVQENNESVYETRGAWAL